MRNHRFIGMALLAASFGIGLLTLARGIFGDEMDNLVVGDLVLKGYALYRDIFSHHFPFPYYWVAMVVGLFGKSVFFARLSVLVFQVIVLAVAMGLSGNYLTVGIVAILWSLLRPFYMGNLVLYSSFVGVLLSAVLIITIAVLQRDKPPHWTTWLTLGILAAITLLSDPLSGYAVAVMLLFLFVTRPSGGLITGSVIAVGLCLYFGVLVVTKTYQNFWDSAILFNSQIYAKYNPANPLRIRELFTFVGRGLDIADPTWFNMDPLRPISTEYTQIDRWFFTGFLYRFAILSCALVLMLDRRFRVALFLYFFAAATLVINIWGFRSQPFVMVSLVAIAALMTGEWWRNSSKRYVHLLRVTVAVMVSCTAVWLGVRLVGDLDFKPEQLSVGAQFAGFETRSTHLQQLSCDNPDVSLAYFPDGTFYQWLTDMKPVSKYVFMWPWVAEVGLDEVIDELGRKEELAIVVREDSVIWGLYDTKEYLQPLDEFLEENYHEVEDGIFLSPELYAKCQP